MAEKNSIPGWLDEKAQGGVFNKVRVLSSGFTWQMKHKNYVVIFGFLLMIILGFSYLLNRLRGIESELGRLQVGNTSIIVPPKSNMEIDGDIDYRPLVFSANEEGFIRLNSKQLGYNTQEPMYIEVHGFSSQNPIVSQMDSLYSPCRVDRLNEKININGYVKVVGHKELELRAGFYYLRTSLGDLRIVVLEKDLPEADRLYPLFMFYTSIAGYGRSANDFTGKDALKVVFYSDHTASNFCTGHVNLFQSIFKDFFPMRRIDFYGFGKSNAPIGHSVLEVNIKNKWVVVDPMFGFIPLDPNRGNPLSFLETLEARERNQFVAKHTFKIPDLTFWDEKYTYFTNPPEGESIKYLSVDNVEYVWSNPQIIVFWPNTDVFYMQRNTYNRMREGDWSRYKEHYQDIFRSVKDGKALKERVRVNIEEDLY